LRLIGNPGNDAKPLQLPSVHHNPTLTDVYVMLKRTECEKEFARQNLAKERLSVIYTFR